MDDRWKDYMTAEQAETLVGKYCVLREGHRHRLDREGKVIRYRISHIEWGLHPNVKHSGPAGTGVPGFRCVGDGWSRTFFISSMIVE